MAAKAAANAAPKPDYTALQDKISRAKSLLILDKAFYGSLICNRVVIIDENTPTASCSAKGTIRIGPKFAEPLTTKQMVFLLAHEVMHYAMQHLPRKGGRDMAKWNWATDAWINETLIANSVGEFIDGGIRHQGAEQLSADELYAVAPEQPPGGGGGALGNDLSTEDGAMDQATAAAVEAQVKRELVQAAKAARSKGDLPASLQRLIDEITNIKTPWYDILERYMQGMVRDDLSWQRPNKRLHHMGVYLPAKGYVPRMGPVVLGVDTSGSIGPKELAEFYGHVNRIMEACLPEKIYVVQCDARIGDVSEYTAEDLPIHPDKVTGGGGTDMPKIFQWVDEQGLEPDVVVILTDGYTNFDDPPAHENVWLMTSDVVAPYGTTVKFEE